MDKEYAKYILEKTNEDYNKIADDFSRTRSFLWDGLKPLSEHTKPGDKVLDLGCGNGRLLQIFEGKNIDYFGIDNSEKLIEVAKKKYPDYNFQIADAFNLPFPENFFDKIYSIAVLHHIPSNEFRTQFLTEANRVLRSGGILILSVWNLWQKKTSWQSLIKNTILKILGRTKLDLKDIFYPWKNSEQRIIIQRYFHLFTRKELRALFKRTGFKVKEIKIWEKEKGSNFLILAEKP